MRHLCFDDRKPAAFIVGILFAVVNRFSRKAGPLLLLLLPALSAMADATGRALPQSKISSAPAETPKAKPAWERIVMIGASVSAGFTESEPLGGPRTQLCRLSRYLDAALLVPHEPVRNLGNTFFFLRAEEEGREQIAEALKARPTLVVGVDFLFWFCYGHVREESERLQRFETGLKLLEKLRCPLLLGDIPDASGAADRMLSEEEIPSAEVIATANRRLQEWAATHRQVVIVSLSDFMRRVMANQALSIHGKTLPRGRTRVLLQDDKLHPSPPGCAFLALAMVDALQTAQPALFAGEVRWNPAEVLRLGVGIPQGPPDNSTNRAPASVSAGK